MDQPLSVDLVAHDHCTDDLLGGIPTTLRVARGHITPAPIGWLAAAETC